VKLYRNFADAHVACNLLVEAPAYHICHDLTFPRRQRFEASLQLSKTFFILKPRSIAGMTGMNRFKQVLFAKRLCQEFDRAMPNEKKRELVGMRKAATLIRPGQFVFLDSGSTNLTLVEYLPEDADLTVATNSVEIAAAASRRPDLRLIVIGGAVDHGVGGCVDGTATLSLANMNIDLGVIGACAASASAGVSVQDPYDAAFKRALLAASRERLVLATSDKLGARAPYRVAELKDIDTFVVEHDASAEALNELAAAGCNALTAESPE
jgi:DeoR/GlpR family transcriptional regulator of sugar metabolism